MSKYARPTRIRRWFSGTIIFLLVLMLVPAWVGSAPMAELQAQGTLPPRPSPTPEAPTATTEPPTPTAEPPTATPEPTTPPPTNPPATEPPATTEPSTPGGQDAGAASTATPILLPSTGAAFPGPGAGVVALVAAGLIVLVGSGMRKRSKE